MPPIFGVSRSAFGFGNRSYPAQIGAQSWVAPFAYSFGKQVAHP